MDIHEYACAALDARYGKVSRQFLEVLKARWPWWPLSTGGWGFRSLLDHASGYGPGDCFTPDVPKCPVWVARIARDRSPCPSWETGSKGNAAELQKAWEAWEEAAKGVLDLYRPVSQMINGYHKKFEAELRVHLAEAKGELAAYEWREPGTLGRLLAAVPRWQTVCNLAGIEPTQFEFPSKG